MHTEVAERVLYQNQNQVLVAEKEDLLKDIITLNDLNEQLATSAVDSGSLTQLRSRLQDMRAQAEM